MTAKSTAHRLHAPFPLVLLAVAVMLLVPVGFASAVIVEMNLHADLVDQNMTVTNESGIHPRVAMFAYDSDQIMNNTAPLTGFMWDGATIQMDLNNVDPGDINVANAVFDNSDNFIGIDLNVNDQQGANFLDINPDGTLDFSASLGPFGSGVYATGPKATNFASFNIHADLMDNTGEQTDLFPRVAMFTVDLNALVNGQARVEEFMWDGATIVMDLNNVDPADVFSANALVSGGEVTGLNLEINDQNGANALTLNPDGTLQFSASVGPFGDGVYAIGPKEIDRVGYNLSAELVDVSGGADDQTGDYPGIGMFFFDANAVVNGKARLEDFMWDGGAIELDLSLVGPEDVNSAIALINAMEQVSGLDVSINDSITADALFLNPDLTLEFSASEGPFGDGTYSFEAKDGDDDGGNRVVTPEPASTLLLLLSAGAMLRRRKRSDA